MKKLYALVALLCLATSLLAQFQWEHTGGPEGFSSGKLYYNKDFAFLYDDFQLFRLGNGQSWEAINTTREAKINVSEQRISIYAEQKKGMHNPKEIQFLLSNDNGYTWNLATVPQDAYFNNNQTMLCSHGVYFQAGEKLYRSQNDGQSWKQVSYDGVIFDTLFSSGDKIFGRNKDTILEFNPQSAKWVFSWKLPPTPEMESIFIKGSNIIVRAGNRFYSSLNKGDDWVTFHTSTNEQGYLIEKDNKVYFLSGKLMRYTEDGGLNWNSFSLDHQCQNFGLFKDKFLLFSTLLGYHIFDNTDDTYLPANQGLSSPRINYLWASQNQVWAQLYSGKIYKLDVSSGLWSFSGLPIADFLSSPFLISTSGNILYQAPGNMNISGGLI